MSDFDPELYLRIVGEDFLLDGDDQRIHRGMTPFALAADALLVAGRIERVRADAIVDDYLEALEARSAHHHLGRRDGTPPPTPSPESLPSGRTAVVDRTWQRADGTLTIRDVTLTDEETKFSFVLVASTPDGTPPPRRRRPGMPRPGSTGHPSLIVADDTGAQRTVSDFSGGYSENRWDGELTTRQPLSPTTAWLELEGDRVELPDPPPPVPVVIEPAPGDAPVHRFLWGRLGAFNQPFGRPVRIAPALDALIAAGVEPDDPVYATVRAVDDALPDHLQMAHAQPNPSGPLPAPWASLLARIGADDGPVCSVAVSTRTPEFDATIIEVSRLRSGIDGFEIGFAMTPNRLQDHNEALGWIAWWARDDLGNHYLGSPGGWGGGENSCSGEISFWPALDPEARRVDLMPTRPEHRAIIPVALPEPDEAAR